VAEAAGEAKEQRLQLGKDATGALRKRAYAGTTSFTYKLIHIYMCVCVCVCVCVYIYIHICKYIFKDIYLSMYIYMGKDAP